jgi:hypothetical protein
MFNECPGIVQQFQADRREWGRIVEQQVGRQGGKQGARESDYRLFRNKQYTQRRKNGFFSLLGIKESF